MSDTVGPKAVVTLMLLLLSGVAAEAQPAFLVEDLNTTRSGGIVVEFDGRQFFPDSDVVAAGGTAYFTATDGIHGSELWASDGTPAGTRLVADICPGSCSSIPDSLTVVGGQVFLLADDGIHGRELWKSDGTTAGTRLVKDLVKEEESVETFRSLTEANGLLIFSLASFGHRQKLWRSDGTAAGTFQLAETVTNGWTDFPVPLTSLGGKLLYRAEDVDHGVEIWVTDGSVAGTGLLKDINPAGSGSSDTRAAAAGGKVLFAATDGAQGFELWASDGTAAGTVPVKDLLPGMESSHPREMTTVGSQVFFFAADSLGFGLWKSNGTAAGTVRVGSVPSTARSLIAAEGKLYFFADCRLWTSNGTAAGTAQVNAFDSESFCYFLPADAGAGPLFVADDGVHGLKLWKSDGTPAGTRVAADVYPYAQNSGLGAGAILGGRWYFRAKGEEEIGTQLWTTDGTPAGTSMLRINRQASGLAVNVKGRLVGPRALFDLDGTLLFQGDDGTAGAELWRSDGTAAGTSLVEDLRPGPGSSLPGEITRAGDTVFLRSDAGSLGEKLWRTDGTPGGTQELLAASHLHNGGLFSPRDLTPLGDEILFAQSWWDDFSLSLQKSDGTVQGTGPITSQQWGPHDPTDLQSIVSLGSQTLLQAGSGTDELWRSDGTEAGTFLLANVLSPRRDLKDSSAARGGVLYFAGFNAGSGEELWRSDGTVAGTYLLAETVAGPGSQPLGPFATAGAAVFFAAGGDELWKNDAGGTALVRALPGAPSVGIRWLTPLGNKVYFSYDDGVAGRELWVSDGTPAGTRRVEDVNPGAGSSHPQQLHAEGGILVFSASDGMRGFEPWRSNGTAVGTRLLHDVAPGALPSSPVEFTASGPNVYFAANDGTTGFELWALPRPALLSTFVDVPADHWAWRFVEALAARGATGGCGGDSYCSDRLLSRAEMAIFLLASKHGAGYTPPPATGTRFADVPATYWAAPWIEQLAAQGITGGCGGGNFCPGAPLSRAEMAIFLLLGEHGMGYTPPPATGTRFTDVPASYWAAAWIERLAAEGITGGCGPGLFCPGRTVTRAEMAVFLTATFELPTP